MLPRRVDKKNRLRNKMVSFRVSPEEWKQFEIAVELAGMTKQDYFISRVLHRDIVVQGNPRVYRALREQLKEVLEELNRINGLIEGVDGELLETIQLITDTLYGLKKENNRLD